MSDPFTVRPGDYGGYSQSGEKETGTYALTAQGVTSTCRIVAICGVNDYQDTAAPDHDGWFLSDFYYLNHIFEPLSAHQTWLTCLQPATLVEKYGEYAHGNPRLAKRRVVLNAARISQIKYVSVCPAEDLLQHSCKTIREHSEMAKSNDQTLILVLLGHGEPGNFRLLVGGKKNQATAEHRANRLTPELIRRAVVKDTKLLLISTACFSGGWVVSPLFNANMMAATTSDDVSISWPCASRGRACGSVFASSIVYALMEHGLELEKDQYGESDLTGVEDSTTFAALTKAVHEAYEEREGAPEGLDQPSPTFSAKDDAWDMLLRSMGLNIKLLLGRDQDLPLISRSETSGTLALIGGIEVSSDTRYLYPRAARRVLCLRAREYLNALPGIHNSGPHLPLYGQILRLMDYSQEVHIDQLRSISMQVEYRMEIMARATEIGRRLGGVGACHLWQAEAYSNRREPNYQSLVRLVRTMHFFEPPLEGEGWQYEKGNQYVAKICFEAFSMDEARPRLLIVKRSMPPGKTLRTVKQLIRHPKIQRSIEAMSIELKKKLSVSFQAEAGLVA